MNLKLATYNIHACIGTDGLFDTDRIIAVIKELDADIIALQEVEHYLVNDIDLLDYLARQTGMTAIAGPTMHRETRHYGNAVLTKQTAIKCTLVDLSLAQYEPRGAIALEFEIERKKLLVVATHFGLKPKERHDQANKLLNMVCQHDVDIHILMGDLNEWFIWGRTLRKLKAYFGNTLACNSFPSAFPLFALDRILVRPNQYLINVFAHQSTLAKKASDHLPLVANIRF